MEPCAEEVHSGEKLQMIVIILLFNAILIGCSGQLYTINGAKPIHRDDGQYLKGVTAYPPKLFIESYTFTAYVIDGKVLRTANGHPGSNKCEPNLIQNIVTRPDYSAPYQLVYEPGLLESQEFGVTLKDGLLVTVNIKGTPDKGDTIKNIVPSLVDISGKTMGLAAPDEKVLCNASPTFKDIAPYLE